VGGVWVWVCDVRERERGGLLFCKLDGWRGRGRRGCFDRSHIRLAHFSRPCICRTPGRAHASSRPLEPPLLPLTKAVPARPLTRRAHRPRIKKLSSHAVKRGLQRGPRPAAHLPPLAARATPGLPASCPASAGRRAAPHAAYPRRPAAAASAPTAAAVFCAAAWPRPPARPSSPGAPPRRVRGVAGPQRCRGQTGERERERGE